MTPKDINTCLINEFFMVKAIKSISVDTGDVEYLDKRGLSASRVFRSKVEELRCDEDNQKLGFSDSKIELQGKVLKLTRLIGKYAGFVNERILDNEFNEYCESGRVKEE